jgi:hypothetical protein
MEGNSAHPVTADLFSKKRPDPAVCALEVDEVKCASPGCTGPFNCEKRKDQWDSKT